MIVTDPSQEPTNRRVHGVGPARNWFNKTLRRQEGLLPAPEESSQEGAKRFSVY